MENKYYQIYTDGNIDLASSIVLKHHQSALAVNQWVLINTTAEFDVLDPRTWKYYKNVAGEYFTSDIRMVITSMDTLEEIEFSKENLKFHRATKKAYGFGTTYYKELVDNYPNQEQLIRGILYPVDIDAAIAAYDGEILTYPPALVEDTEPSLIPKLQEFINGYFKRWDNRQYANTDNLYDAALLGILYVQLPAAIENIRKQACLTHEAHSYHVKQYLASHSRLDQYLPYLTRSQAMYFYHNLAYIEKNNGKEEIFDELLQRVFTDRQIPLGHFTLKHSTEKMPDNLIPEIVFDKTPLNTVRNIDGIDQYTLDQVLDIEDGLLGSNRLLRDSEQAKASVLLSNALNPNLPTKLLQSTTVDYTDSEHYKLGDIALQHWVWLAKKDYYRAYITFTVPATGSRLSLNALDAFCLYAYAFCNGNEMVLNKLPTVAANRVQRIPRGSIASMREVCEPKYVPDSWLGEMQVLMPAVKGMISVEAFREHLVELFNAANEQYANICFEEKLTARGQKEAAVCRLWGDELFSLADYPDQNYEAWFAERNIVLGELNSEQLRELANVILAEAIGSNLSTTITLRDTQRALASMFLELSSYSIQLGLNINSGAVIDAGFVSLRLDDPDIKTEGSNYYIIGAADPMDIRISTRSDRELDLNKYPVFEVAEQRQASEINYEIQGVDFGLEVGVDSPVAVVVERQYTIGVGFSCEVNLTVDNPRKLTIVPGMEEFLKLPLEVQLASYVDTWAS